MVSPSAAAFTVSSHEVLDQKQPGNTEGKFIDSVCDTPGCVLAGNINDHLFMSVEIKFRNSN